VLLSFSAFPCFPGKGPRPFFVGRRPPKGHFPLREIQSGITPGNLRTQFPPQSVLPPPIVFFFFEGPLVFTISQFGPPSSVQISSRTGSQTGPFSHVLTAGWLTQNPWKPTLVLLGGPDSNFSSYEELSLRAAPPRLFCRPLFPPHWSGATVPVVETFCPPGQVFSRTPPVFPVPQLLPGTPTLCRSSGQDIFLSLVSVWVLPCRCSQLASL